MLGSQKVQEFAMCLGRFITDRSLKGMVLAAIALVTAAVLVFASPKGEQVIPLSSIITTSSQAKMRHFNDILPIDESNQYQRKFNVSSTHGRNAFLVDATNELDAINASANVFFGPFQADKAATVSAANPKRGSHWLVTYLGSGPSTPTWFVVQSVTVGGNNIRLTYSTSKAQEVTADVRRYFYWVPLGRLKPGTFRIELYDSNLKAVTLARDVEMKPKN